MTSDRPVRLTDKQVATLTGRARLMVIDDSIVALAEEVQSSRARITELERENAALRAQFKDADEVAAEFANWHGGPPPEGWFEDGFGNGDGRAVRHDQ